MAEKPLLAANWKMNPVTAAAAAALVEGVAGAAAEQASVAVALFPPFVWLEGVARQVKGSALEAGAQDCYWAPSGAFTGEVSAQMLATICKWVIVGHSERRVMGESSADVARKARAALQAGLRTIICVGESQEQHDSGEAERFVAGQVHEALAECTADDSRRLVLAYEPIWAIGSGKSAQPEDAYKMMRLIRRAAAEIIGTRAGTNLRVLYGGSVNAENVERYVGLPRCDGCLVGGASLKAGEFSEMIRRTAAVYAGGAV